MRVHPASGIRTRVLRLSSFEACLPALAWIVESRVLTAALERALSFSAVRPVQGEVASLSDVSDGGTKRLELADGRSISARLVVAADGAQSPVRSLAGIEASLREYPQRALVANFNTRKSHRDIAWQWFGEHGILALLPLPADTESDWPGRCSIVWSAPHALADELQQLEPQALADRVSKASGGALGDLHPISPLASWPLRLGRVNTLIGRRLALVGDAAHIVHPLAGQGMNLGFGDVCDLVAALRDATDPGARLVLRRYERSRAEPVLAMRTLTDGLQRLFDDHSIRRLGPLAMPFTLARDLGWQLVAGSSWLRRRLVDHAARH
jgi:ubiquinone biosynthesis UbiH/UbiF/VisC/COQ6 family hydroxylase